MEIEFNWFLRINRKTAKVVEEPEIQAVIDSQGLHERRPSAGFQPNEEWFEDRRR